MSAAIASVQHVAFMRGEYYLINYAGGRRRFCYDRTALPTPVKQFLIGLDPVITTAADGATVTTWKED